jgi:hypothetical protein
LDRLAENSEPTVLSRIANFIHKASEGLEQKIASSHIQPEQLTKDCRIIRGWLAYFASLPAFETYLQALRMAQAILAKEGIQRFKWSAPILICFKPVRSYYRISQFRSWTRITLPTSMIRFTEAQFQLLSDMMFQKKSNGQAISEALLSDPCRDVRLEIEILGGSLARPAGMFHHLDASFDRVNVGFFGGALNRPKLSWSWTFTTRVLGHYNYLHDEVMISATLDHSEVPEYVVDFIMYHELLHKKLGFRWENGRRQVHTQEFSRMEALFPKRAEANKTLKKLVQDWKDQTDKKLI